MRSLISSLALGAVLLLGGCADGARVRYATTDRALELERVVLYRNGIGYFERHGEVDGNQLVIKVRKDQVNDLLKSLTIVDRKSGRAVSVSMPLDPQTWANAALATLAPGQGSLAQVLDALRGTAVVLSTTDGTVRGRVTMVEELQGEPPEGAQERAGLAALAMRDHRVTLMDDQDLQVVRLSRVKSVTLEDGDLAMQFHRSLDATAGEGMFQQVDVAIRLAGDHSHDLAVSYVVAAPMWKPTYRVVLPEAGKGEALLQGWAVVDNTSGEDWHDVSMQLTSGEPIAFRYDLHTPRDVNRSDLTETGVRKRASVAVGETSYDGEPPREEQPPAAAPVSLASKDELSSGEGEAAADRDYRNAPAEPSAAQAPARASRARQTATGKKAAEVRYPGGAAGWDDKGYGPMGGSARAEAPKPAIDIESLRRSTQAQTRATAISGLTRFDLQDRVTVPEGTSTMVAIVNQAVQAEETFLFKPGGAGIGYESNPYRVVRFKNSTPFVLEPGPISIYTGGSFVGEGLSEAVGAGTSATVPFAVEPGIMVSSLVKQQGEEMRILRIVRGILEVESFSRTQTVWTAKAQTLVKGFTVLVRHPKAGSTYQLKDRPDGTEDLLDAYLVPLKVPAGSLKGSVEVVEQTPARMQLEIWDQRAPGLLEKLMLSTNLGAEARTRLEPIVRVRQEIGRIDTRIDGAKRQQVELDERASETRRNLLAIQKDNSGQAAALRAKLQTRLDEFTREGDRLGREIVSLESERLEKKIQLEDMLQNLDLTAPPPTKAPAPSGPFAPAPPAPAPSAPPPPAAPVPGKR